MNLKVVMWYLFFCLITKLNICFYTQLRVTSVACCWEPFSKACSISCVSVVESHSQKHNRKTIEQYDARWIDIIERWSEQKYDARWNTYNWNLRGSTKRKS